ncbi:phosphatases II [Lenzites betulinus]|nr:phosphatases II [Lenzites betulinus]
MPEFTINVVHDGMPIAECLSLCKGRSPPSADTVLSMLRSATLDDDYFHRRALHKLCTQHSPLEDFLPQASEIIPGLIVCDMYTATTPATLQRLNITHVVSVMNKPPYRYPKPIQHLCVPIDDQPTANLLDYLEGAVAWIHAAIAGGGRVIVHCMWGMSRSASVAIAYLIAQRGMTLGQAHSFVRSRRRIVRPNSGFLNQLTVYDRIIRLRRECARRQAKQRASTKDGLDVDELTRRVALLTQS